MSETEEGEAKASPFEPRRFTRRHAGIVGVCGAGMAFDGLELGMNGVFAAVFARDPNVAPGELGLLISVSALAVVLGAPVFGWLADRFGRRPALVGTLIGFGTFSLFCAATHSMPALIIARFLASICVGAYRPVQGAYLVDTMPSSARGSVMYWTVVLAGPGGASPMFLTRAFNVDGGFEGWRVPLIVGGVGGLLVAALTLWLLPESPKWLNSQGRRDEAIRAYGRLEGAEAAKELEGLKTAGAAVAKRARFSALFSPEYRARLALLVAVEFLAAWAVIFIALQGAVFALRGYDLNRSLVFTGISMLSVPVGALLTTLFVDKIDRGTAMASGATVFIGLAIAFLLIPGAPAALTLATLMTMVSAMCGLGAMVYASEMFPTELRGTATTVGHATNGLGLAVSPLVLLPMLKGEGEMLPIAVMCATQVALIATVLSLGRRIRRGIT
jgi:putative MFS transporter